MRRDLATGRCGRGSVVYIVGFVVFVILVHLLYLIKLKPAKEVEKRLENDNHLIEKITLKDR